MCTLYNKITDLCKEKGVSGSRMCLDLGLSKSTMSDLKNGRIKGISVPTAQKISGYFGITVDELYGEEDKKIEPTDDGRLSEKKKEFIRKVEGMSDDQIARLEQILALVENTEI